MAFLVMLFALICTLFIMPAAVLFKVVTLQANADWFWRIALSLDQFANVLADDLLNALLLKTRAKQRFGNEDETISSVIGKNFLAGSLTRLGLWVRYVLHRLDKNHSVKSIERDEG